MKNDVVKIILLEVLVVFVGNILSFACIDYFKEYQEKMKKEVN